MKTLKFACIAFALAATETITAGGLLTNTNQNIVFLRNPARDAAIGIDGVYSNPAGVVFLGDGIHLSLNLQNAHQTRTVETAYGPLFNRNTAYPATINSNGLAPRKFKGEADAPIIPSIQAAWNKGKWSLQFGFAITGGGGKCEFSNGLGSFEGVVGTMAAAGGQTIANTIAPSINQINSNLTMLNNMGIPVEQIGEFTSTGRYSFNAYMRGRQYYYGFTLGAAYKINNNLAVYAGARMLYGTSNYYGYVKNIKIEDFSNAATYLNNASKQLAGTATALNGNPQLANVAQQLNGAAEQLSQASQQMEATGEATTAGSDITLNCDQSGWGIAPIIGVDYKTGKLNLAAKYEFKTRMRLKNRAANSASAKNISMLDKYADGNKVAEDSPALLTVGAQYEILPSLRVMAGWHHYFDVDTKQYTKDMMSDSNEYLFGAEYDICKNVQVSAGAQRTVYGTKDEGINDISFNVSSWSIGLGVGVTVSEKVKINAAYFQTLYDDYNKVEQTVTNSFTRTNRVLGLGVDLTL